MNQYKQTNEEVVCIIYLIYIYYLSIYIFIQLDIELTELLTEHTYLLQMVMFLPCYFFFSVNCWSFVAFLQFCFFLSSDYLFCFFRCSVFFGIWKLKKLKIYCRNLLTNHYCSAIVMGIHFIIIYMIFNSTFLQRRIATSFRQSSALSAYF